MKRGGATGPSSGPALRPGGGEPVIELGGASAPSTRGSAGERCTSAVAGASGRGHGACRATPKRPPVVSSRGGWSFGGDYSPQVTTGAARCPARGRFGGIVTPNRPRAPPPGGSWSIRGGARRARRARRAFDRCRAPHGRVSRQLFTARAGDLGRREPPPPWRFSRQGGGCQPDSVTARGALRALGGVDFPGRRLGRPFGGVAERLIAPVLKIGGPKGPRGFESHPLRSATSSQPRARPCPSSRAHREDGLVTRPGPPRPHRLHRVVPPTPHRSLVLTPDADSRFLHDLDSIKILT